MNDMNSLFNEVEAELLRQWKATPQEQLTKQNKLRQIQRDWEAIHTPVETNEDREEDDD